MTPITPVIPVQFLMPQARAGILKKSHITRDVSDRSEPPGPPCGLPPLIGYDDDVDDEIPSKRRVRFEEDISNSFVRDGIEAPDDDFGPVESNINTPTFFLFFYKNERIVPI